MRNQFQLTNYKQKLIQSEHLVPTDKLTEKEPATYIGTYSGKFNNKDYYYRAGVTSAIAWNSPFASSTELIEAEKAYIDLYRENSWMKDHDWTIRHYDTFWDGESEEDCDRLVNQGVIPSQEVFVFEKLGIS